MANTDEVYEKLEKVPGVEYRALIANLRGVERAIACGCKKVKLNVSASRAHNLANLNRTPEESVARFGDCVTCARKRVLRFRDPSPWLLDLLGIRKSPSVLSPPS